MAWDSSSRESTLKSASRLRESGVRVSLGGDGADLLDARPVPACVVKSPGIPPAVPLISRALRRGVEVIDEAELGWRFDSRPFLGVTGTNGKSTVAALLAAALEAGGHRPCVAGNTHFGPPLCALPRQPDVVVAEVSSYQLEASPTLIPDLALHTNLSPHHLGRHRSLRRYAECKRRLFVRGGRAAGLAVCNADDPFGRRLAREVVQGGGLQAGYGTHAGAGYRLRELEWGAGGARLRVEAPGADIDLTTRLPGRHNAYNALAAFAAACELGVAPEAAARGIAGADPVPGRWESVGASGGPEVVVDYAHNPAAIEAVARLGRELTRRSGGGRLIAVLSAVGILNDAREQHEMGATAARLCDRVLLTTMRWRADEPREPSHPLLEGARSGSATTQAVPDRAEAIRSAILEAGESDCVLILGRGAFDGPLFDQRGGASPFDDRTVAREAAIERERR